VSVKRGGHAVWRVGLKGRPKLLDARITMEARLA
jgi:hypothetical protein